MSYKSTISNIDRIPNNKNLNSSFKCPEDFKSCRFYYPDQPDECKCIKDSTIGYCVEEYFYYYDKASEGITRHGDSK